MNAQDTGGGQVLTESAVVPLEVFGLEPVEPVVSETGGEVQPDQGPVALERAGPHLAGGDVLEPVLEPAPGQ